MILVYIYVYKQDLALNNPQRLIGHKIQPTKSKEINSSNSHAIKIFSYDVSIVQCNNERQEANVGNYQLF